MKAAFYTKSVYGVENKYLSDPELAKNVSSLTGRKTITDSDMRTLKALGFEFEEVIAPKKLN